MKTSFKEEVIPDYYNVPEGTDEIVKIEDIIIPDDFKNTQCSHNKVRWAKEYYIRNGHFDKPISVIVETNERGLPNKLILIDQYSRYLAAQKLLWITHLPVKYIDINDTELTNKYM
jgi:hypothetical protein